MGDKKVICWDLDETLGYFGRIKYEFMGIEVEEGMKPTSLRFGLTELLSSLSSEGYEHVITTSGSTDYANFVLERTGLTDYFSHVFGGETVSEVPGGKSYKKVAEAVGFSDDEALSNMIVIGDQIGDKPADLEGLVFVQHRDIMYTDAGVTAKILERLIETGEGNFKQGFEKMYQDSDVEYEGHEPHLFEFRTYDIGDGIKVEVKYNYNNSRMEVIPTITRVQADDYKRDPVLVEGEEVLVEEKKQSGLSRLWSYLTSLGK